ncbi:MAG: hypothetical protein IJG65_02490 [Synergistaceae bacterium]|nr:hypothetical protein [Synergistaceae bacterium]
MYMYKDLTGCDEPGRKDYPNRALWVRYCPEDADDDELEYYGLEDEEDDGED